MSSHVREEPSWTLPSLIEQAISATADAVAARDWSKAERFAAIVWGFVGPDPKPKEHA